MENVVPPPSLPAFSSTTGRRPASCAASAVATPAMPDPMTTTSKVSSQLMSIPPATNGVARCATFNRTLSAPSCAFKNAGRQPHAMRSFAPWSSDCCCRSSHVGGRATRLGRRAVLPEPAGEADRSVSAGRADRSDGARVRPEAERAMGPAGGDREPRRRQFGDRRAADGEIRAGRLHAAGRDGHHAGDESDHHGEPALRRAQGFRADLAHRAEHVAADRARRRPEDGAGADRQGEGQSRQAQLRRRHHHDAGSPAICSAGLRASKRCSFPTRAAPRSCRGC